MKQASRIAILVVALAAIAACGDATPDPTSAGVSASLSAGSVFDAVGTWKMVAEDCEGFPVKSEFVNTTQTVVGDIQTFATDGDGNAEFDSNGDGNNEFVVVIPSEGTLDTVTGSYILCYSSTLSECPIKCTGTVSASNRVDLSCSKSTGGALCSISLQK